mgnify:CR=1 FL=1
MEQAVSRAGRRSGWSEMENQLLWETADEAQQQGLPLKAVFERIAEQTGRRPNSIRNYYYAAVKSGEAPSDVPTGRAAPFTPFTPEETDDLLRRILMAQGQGISVRACVTALSGGDRALALRLQDKYRALLKSHPDQVLRVLQALRDEGLPAADPYRKIRAFSGEVSLHNAPPDHIVRHLMLRTEGMSDEMTRRYLTVCLSIADLLTAQ